MITALGTIPLSVLLLGAAAGYGQEAARVSIDVPRVERPPAFDDFLDMTPDGDVERRMTRVDDFVQQEPSDGEPPSQRTEAYLAYDAGYLYVVFVAFDTNPDRIRARLTRREDIFNDDFVTVQIDTFNDRRRAFTFLSNPLGVQVDGILTETRGLNFDTSFDTVWRSRGRVTDRGYVVWIAVPFRSLRFPVAAEQRWGLILARENIRAVETVFWPRVSNRVESRLIQAAELRGLRDISPGRNAQIIPYGFSRAFEATDDESAGRIADGFDLDGGLDAKLVVRDSLVLDLTANPDFSQVESDEPQVTTNRRFEVFFPERRPFFLENASFFETPINLLFTRRIADPNVGARLTGKAGEYAVGALVMDDRGRDTVSAFRVSRDIFSQSSIGVIYTRRAAAGAENSVAGVDGRFGFGPNWSLRFQSVTSTTAHPDGPELSGPAHEVEFRRSGRQFNANGSYTDRSEGFRTMLGFDPRPGIRRVFSHARYRFRPENRWLVSYGPSLDVIGIWDRDGQRLVNTVNPWFAMFFRRSSSVFVRYFHERERLRPGDAPNVASGMDFARSRWIADGDIRVIPQVTIAGAWTIGDAINLNPAGSGAPFQGPSREMQLTVTLQPVTPVRIDNVLLFSSLNTPARDAVFTNRILRSKVNWQVTRQLAVRSIVQYEVMSSDARLTSLTPSRRLNGDLLVSYVVNPWTALYAGYNGNARTIDPASDWLQRDAQQFFVKVSYLYRF
jgi:hypothetical protein